MRERRGSPFWEVLILLAAVGLLLVLNLDRFTQGGRSARVRFAEVEHEFRRIWELQEGYRNIYGTYAPSLDSLNFRTMPDALFRYSVVQADSFTFRAEAEALRDYDGDGVLELWQIDHTKRITCKRGD
ncbi:MAG TPA: hypothetical protein EYP17_12525 [Candidatus Latescibacteria bacterium]|nr:hypothetical protein [Candidatus Latescibacterota bacterium]